MDIKRSDNNTDRKSRFWDKIEVTNLKRLVLVSILFALIIGVGLFGLYEHKQKKDYENYLIGDYQKAFYESVDYIDNVDKILDKIKITKLPEQSSIMFAEIWKQSSSAHENLSALPYNYEVINTTLKFLSQVSDFSYYCLSKTSEGKELNKDDWEKVDKIKEYAKILSGELNSTASQANMQGSIDWNKIKNYNLENNEDFTGSMSTVSKQFQKYPSLIYDGPFSEHVKTIEPKMIKDKEVITKEQGADIVKNFLIDREVKKVNFIGETEETTKYTIPVYSYEVFVDDNDKASLYINVTKQGGYVLWMLDSIADSYSGNTMDIESLLKKAEKFLESNNFKNMKYSYYEINENNAVINFALFEDDIVFYPDLVKVKINMNSGIITGFEAEGYIYAHHNRNFEEPKIDIKQAESFISDKFDIESTNKAVIMLDSKKEVLCYEFKGEFENAKYIVYINAETGKIENIFELLIDETGILAE